MFVTKVQSTGFKLSYMPTAEEYIQTTDEELFALVQKHDEHAFRVLYKRYNRQIYSYCRRILGDDLAAEDAFQTVVATIYEKRDSFTGGSFSAWFYAIARNRCIKLLRKEKPKMRLDDLPAIENTLVHEQHDDVVLQDVIGKAIADLPEDLREAFELRYLDDYQYDQIASILNISLSLAKVRVFRARKLIQKTLSPYIHELQ